MSEKHHDSQRPERDAPKPVDGLSDIAAGAGLASRIPIAWGGAGIALIVVLALVVYGELLIPGKVPYSRHSDIVPQRIAVKHVLHESIEERGALPYWRDDQMSGGPAATQPQALYTYPFDFLYWLLPTLFAVGPTFWLHLLLAAFGCYFAGHALNLSKGAKLIMGASGLLSFKLMLVVYAGWQPIIPAISLLPWYIAAIIYFCKDPGLKRALFLSLTIAGCLHTGALQYFFFATLIMFVYVLVELIGKLTGGARKKAGALVLGLAASGILGFCMSAYLWLPVAVDIPMLSRMERSYDFFLSGHALKAKHLMTFFNPEALGSPLDKTEYYPELWEDVGYFGLIPLILAFVGAWQRRGDGLVRFLAAGFLLSALLAFETPVLKFAYLAVPGFDLFRCPARMLFITSYLGIALAGYGAEAVFQWIKARVEKKWALFSIVSAILLFMTAEAKIRADGYIKTVSHDYVLPSLPFMDILKKDNERFRIASIGRSTLNYGWAAPNGLQIISGYDPYLLNHYRRYFGLLETGLFIPPSGSPWLDLSDIRRTDLLDALNVRYLITQKPIEPARLEFTEVGRFKNVPTFKFYKGMFSQGVFVYRNERFKKRAFFVDEVIGVADEAEMERIMLKTDLSNQAVALFGGPSSPMISLADQGDRINVVVSQPGLLSLNVKNKNERFMVFSEIWHPGWQASMDGKTLELFRTDLALMGAWIEPGEHKVVLSFYPPLFKLGLWLSACAALFWLGSLVFWLKRNNRRIGKNREIGGQALSHDT